MSRPACATGRIFRLPHATGKNAYRETRETALGWELAFSYTWGMMVAQAPFRVYFSDGEVVIRELTENMAAAGMRVVKTFDLRAACTSFTDNICPHHGVAPCDCQLVVLQVYVPGETPVSLVLHSHRGLTEVQWDTDPASRPSPESRTAIIAAMSEVAGLPFGREQDALEDAGQDGS